MALAFSFPDVTTAVCFPSVYSRTLQLQLDVPELGIRTGSAISGQWQ